MRCRPGRMIRSRRRCVTSDRGGGGRTGRQGRRAVACAGTRTSLRRNEAGTGVVTVSVIRPAWTLWCKRVDVVPRQRERDEVVDKAVRWVVVSVLRNPADPAWQADHRSAAREDLASSRTRPACQGGASRWRAPGRSCHAKTVSMGCSTVLEYSMLIAPPPGPWLAGNSVSDRPTNRSCHHVTERHDRRRVAKADEPRHPRRHGSWILASQVRGAPARDGGRRCRADRTGAPRTWG